jgi:hypothetical protein
MTFRTEVNLTQQDTHQVFETRQLLKGCQSGAEMNTRQAFEP